MERVYEYGYIKARSVSAARHIPVSGKAVALCGAELDKYSFCHTAVSFDQLPRVCRRCLALWKRSRKQAEKH